jgi:hypothetical protein
MTTAAIAQPVDTGTEHERARPWPLGEAMLAVVLVGSLGLLFVQPWEAIPFPIIDFGGWLAMLSSSDSAAAGFRALVEEHAREGRVNPLSMAYVALNWALFGAQPVGWQLLRAAIMLGIAGIGYTLFRTLGANRGAALAGAAFFVITDSARSVWLLPQAVEHVATLFILLASLVAASYHSAARPQRSAIAIAALLVLAIWVREPMAAAVPFVVLLALSHRGEGRLAIPRAERRSVLLIGVVGIAIAILNVIPVIAVRSLERSAGYASRFGPENISLGNVKNVLSALMLPVTREPLFPANAVFVLMLATAAVGASVAARRYRSMLLLAGTLPLAAAAIYAMWPSFPGNYALPYVPGIALAFALALTALWEGSRIRRALAVAGTCIVVGYGALLTFNGRREYAASRLLDGDMANAVSAIPSSRLVVAVDDPLISGGFGRGLVMYAKATRGQAPAPAQASDVDCGAAARLVAGLPADVTVLRVGDACRTADLATPTTTLTRTASIRDWKTLRRQRWTTAAAFWHGAGAP